MNNIILCSHWSELSNKVDSLLKDRDMVLVFTAPEQCVNLNVAELFDGKVIFVPGNNEVVAYKPNTFGVLDDIELTNEILKELDC